MSPVFATQRRAEEFNTLVESSTGALDDARYADILAPRRASCASSSRRHPARTSRWPCASS